MNRKPSKFCFSPHHLFHVRCTISHIKKGVRHTIAGGGMVLYLEKGSHIPVCNQPSSIIHSSMVRVWVEKLIPHFTSFRPSAVKGII